MSEKLVYGVGINDADYIVHKKMEGIKENGKRKQITIFLCPYYVTWKEMLRRGYHPGFKEKRPTYKDCTVCPEWHLFSSFKAWMESQDWEGKELDKDILFPGNKLYSPETCCFVSKLVNTFIIDRTNDRGQWPVGVHWNKQHSRFRAYCNNPFNHKQEHLGYYQTVSAAWEAWRQQKLKLATIIAETQTKEIGEALVNRYKYMTLPFYRESDCDVKELEE